MKTNQLYFLFVTLPLALVLCSCEDFLAVDPPTTTLTTATVFSDVRTAEAVLAGLYQRLGDRGFASGEESFTWLTGVASDELDSYFSDGRAAFAAHAVTSQSTLLTNHWGQLYRLVYGANAVIEGLDGSPLPASDKDRLAGEAYFLRAFCYFYLAGYWGGVPLALTTDYAVNQSLTRSTRAAVLAQVAADLRQAEALLPASYAGSGRLRPNRWAAVALRARVHLYAGAWAEAAAAAGVVIDAGTYVLESPANAFVATSRETLWHIGAVVPSIQTWDGFRFILTGAPTRVALSPELVHSFAPGDLRAATWVGTLAVGGTTYYFPHKYKVRIGAANVPATEHLVALRLGEQYLIRGEARARQGDVAGALADLNAVRTRAGLLPAEAVDADAVLAAIVVERRHELFTEWSHRWLDLQRMGLMDTVLGGRNGWDSHDAFFPLPQMELDRNRALVQNEGY